MTAKHSDPEYQRNARTIRAGVRSAHRRGVDVVCWRCHRLILPGQASDVGHINPNGGHGMGNLAPEHRHATGACTGNRAAGGKLGATIRTANTAQKGKTQTWPI